VPDTRIRHQPEKTVLYAVVRDHLDAFLRSAREHGALPAFIEKTFRALLKCGIPEHGFIRVHCARCGHDDIVAFSCKRRGVCPSCSARAMGDGAAHLVDHVLPRVPYRQWVVGFPFELNGPLAFQPGFLAATERIVVDALCRWQKARAGGKAQVGGIHVRHRFGGSLNLHIHGHLLLMDGVYRKDADGKLTFTQTPPPREEELKTLAETIHRRLSGLMKRRGMVRTQDTSNEEQQLDALASCGQLALTQGKRERSGPALSPVDEDEVEHPRGGTSATVNGVNVYASSPVDGEDRETLERLCRYLLRGPLALHRLKQRPDGMLTYRLKKPDRKGNTVMVLSPSELLMRLCSLIPAPGHPTRKYFGILAGAAKDRKLVVPKPTHRKRAHAHPDRVAPTASPVKWAELLKRVWGIDALECPKCGGRMTALAVVEDAAEVARYLANTGQATVYQRSQAPPDLAA